MPRTRSRRNPPANSSRNLNCEGWKMGIFERYAPFVQEYIYRNGWENLRAIQVAAANAIFNTSVLAPSASEALNM